MKLLYIHQYFKFPDQTGGTRSYDLSTSFIKKGIDVVVISSNPDKTDSSEKWSYVERDGIKLYMLNCEYNNRMSFYRRIYAFLYFMWHATTKAINVKCDVVLATSTPLTIAIPAMVKRLVDKTPYVFEVRDVWPDVPIRMGYFKNSLVKKLLYWFEKRVYKSAHWVVPLSDGMKDNIVERMDFAEKMTVIPNISEINRFQFVDSAEQQNANTKSIVYAGTMGDVNGLSYLVDLAAATIKLDKTICFEIYGKGKQEEELRRYAESCGVLNNNLFFRGSVSKAELPGIYQRATMGSSFVIDNPILWDNSANKFFDTLAAAKPILINHEGWQADVIRKYQMGYVLPPVVNDQMAKDFVAYINNAELLATHATNAFKVAKDEYSLEVAVKKYINIFNRL